MSVVETMTLPGQPGTSGSTHIVPLGGDGFAAPHSAYSVRAFGADADASGGQILQQIFLDDRYVSLVSFVAVFLDQATPLDDVVRMDIAGATTPTIRENVKLVTNDDTGDATTIWYPPTWVLPGANQVCSIKVTSDNIDGDDQFISCLVYNFDIRVRELTNVGFLGFARGPI